MLGAILGAVSGVSSLLGGILGKSAAEKAADIQAQAAREAAARATQTANEVNPLITGAANTAGQQARTAAGESIAGMSEATGNANALLDPYSELGSKGAGLLSTALDSSGRMPTLDELQMDPGYQFRRDEALKGISGRAAALGLATSGGNAKDIVNYVGKESSQEYNNAFNRFITNRQSNIDNLKSVVGTGLTASSAQGGNLLKNAGYAGDLNYGSTVYGGDKNYDATVQTGRNSIAATTQSNDYLTSGANAEAAGKVGGTNAFINGVTGAAGGVTTGVLLNQALKNPASRYLTKIPNANIMGTMN